jgi:hypothetical protein
MTVTLSRVVSRDPDIDEEVTGELIAETAEWVELETDEGVERFKLRAAYTVGSLANYTAWRVVSRG